MGNLSEVFVDTLYEKATAVLPDEVRSEARKCLLDVLGSMFGGTRLLSEKVNAYLDSLPAANGATVVHSCRKAGLADAAMANGLYAHVFDMDDGHRYSTVHLAATTIPAVLAACEFERRSFDDLLRGIVVGYEASVRLGNCIQPSHRARGFHSSGTIGTVGAAMAVAAALGFSRQQFKDTLSAALTSAAGINEMMENISGMKPFNIGRASGAGITAAYIVRAGFTGPLDPLDGKFGFFRGFCDTYKPEVLSLANDDRWSILGAYHKPYASCRHTHAAIDAALSLRPKLDSLDDITGITVYMYKQGTNGHVHTDIPSLVAGKMSIPFCVGLALKTGGASILGFSDENRLDPDVMRLCRMTVVLPDEALSRQVPDKRSAILEITLKDGRTLTHHAVYALGEPENPMSASVFRTKFTDLAVYGVKSAAQADAIADGVLNGQFDMDALIRAIQ